MTDAEKLNNEIEELLEDLHGRIKQGVCVGSDEPLLPEAAYMLEQYQSLIETKATDSGELTELESENMIMRSALSDITHQREGCFLSKKGNLETVDGEVIRRPEGCVKAIKDGHGCVGCVFADIAADAYKKMNAS